MENKIMTVLFLVWPFIAVESSLADPVGHLENPQPGSIKSGIGVISGWVCNAGRVEVLIDGGQTYQTAYGTIREDTSSVCGDVQNGFGLLFNYNRLGDGPHTVQVFVDGALLAEADFTVVTLGHEFLEGVSGIFTMAGFPYPGCNVALRWQESEQNFVIEQIDCSCDTFSVSPSVLWPPNGRMVPVTVAKYCGSQHVDCTLSLMSCDDGCDANDMSDTADPHTVLLLRAERSGGGDGRRYNLLAQCDGTNTPITITVPHDQGKGSDD
jgi:hypothetical protein